MKLIETLSRKKTFLIYLIALAAAIVLLKMTVFAPPEVKIATVEKRDLSARVYRNGTVEAKVVVGMAMASPLRSLNCSSIPLFIRSGKEFKK